LIKDLLASKVRAVTFCVLISASCGPRLRSFRVTPATPSYLLRSPDSRQTPFPDVLRAYNGFEQGSVSVELCRDMELRVENAYYEPGASRRGLAGFLGTEVAQYKVRSQGGLQLLSVRPMKNRASDQPPVQGLIPPSQQGHRYFRFYYEVLFKKSGNSRGSVLLSANAKEDIDRLAAELISDPDSVCGERSSHCTVFPEACSVSIEMEIVVNGSPRNVIWRSVLSDVIDHPHHIEFFRIYNGRLTPVKIDTNDAGALKLPLLPGDHVRWN
jgi:hypothetical protein